MSKLTKSVITKLVIGVVGVFWLCHTLYTMAGLGADYGENAKLYRTIQYEGGEGGV